MSVSALNRVTNSLWKFYHPGVNQDGKWMRRALTLAKRGMGKTSPNPCVGAILVRNGKKIGEGWHHAAGLPHAEVEAVQMAERNGFRVKGSTLYVTLEPCCTYGRTPPCTKLIRAKGIKRVVVGTSDPNPRHSRRGLAELRRQGVRVDVGILEKECADLNQAWNHWIAKKTPWVIAKCGMTLDGKIATASGESKWITSKSSRAEAQKLRSRVDAILVGVKTVIKDDPSLTVRLPGVSRQPIRVILDTRARTPLSSEVVRSLKNSKVNATWIFVGKRAPTKKVSALEKSGAIVFKVPTLRDGVSLDAVLKTLGASGIVQLLVEGGGIMLASFFEKKLFRELRFFIAPKILGGEKSVKAVAGQGFNPWKNALKIKGFELNKISGDMLIQGIVLDK